LAVLDASGGTEPHHQLFSGSGFHDGFAAIQPISTNLDDYTGSASHEIIEAATDSSIGSHKGWALYDDTSLQPYEQTVWLASDGNLHVEVADLCEGTRIRIGSYLYQRSFSNQAAGLNGDPCVPHDPSQGWFNTTPFISGPVIPVNTGWYAIPSGSDSVDIDV